MSVASGQTRAHDGFDCTCAESEEETIETNNSVTSIELSRTSVRALCGGAKRGRGLICDGSGVQSRDHRGMVTCRVQTDSAGEHSDADVRAADARSELERLSVWDDADSTHLLTHSLPSMTTDDDDVFEGCDDFDDVQVCAGCDFLGRDVIGCVML